MRLLLLVSTAAALAACAPEQAAEPDPPAVRAIVTELEEPQANPTGRLPDPPPPGPPHAAVPELTPLSEVQIMAELGPGPSCDLTEGGAPLLVAQPGDAIAHVHGRIVHLKPEAKDWNALMDGGRFIAKDLRIEVAAGTVVARTARLIERRSDVDVKRGGHGFHVFHGPHWICWP